MRRTVDEIAEVLKVEKKIAQALVTFLTNIGLADFKGERPSPSGKGKGKYVYEVILGAGRVAGQCVQRLES